MDPPDSTETNLSLKSTVLDEKYHTNTSPNDNFLEEFFMGSDCRSDKIESEHDWGEGCEFNFQDVKEDSDSQGSDSCISKPYVPVISEVSTMIEKLKEQNKEMKDKNMEKEMQLAEYEQQLAEKMNNELKIKMERDALKEELSAAKTAQANLEIKVAEKEAELKQFRGLAKKSLRETNELQQLRKDLNISTKNLKKSDKDLLNAQSVINKKNASIRKLRCSNRKLLATVVEFGSVLESKGLLTQKQYKYLKTVKAESLTENINSEETDCEIKENGTFVNGEDIQQSQFNGYNETGSLSSETVNEIEIKTECDYDLQDSFYNGVADESICNGSGVGYSHNEETLNSIANGEGLISHCDNESYNSSLKPHQLLNSSVVATSTLNSNHLQTNKKPLDLLNKNLPVKYSTDHSHNSVNINTDHFKENMLSSNVENMQNNSSLFIKSNELSPDSNFVPIGALKSESVCSEDFMDVSDEDFDAMKQVLFKCNRLLPLSPLPPTPPPSQCKSRIPNIVKKAGNQNPSQNPLPSLASSSKDDKIPPNHLDKRNTLFHQTSRGFDPQIDEPSAKPIVPFNEHPVSVSENASDQTLPSNLYYVSARQVNDSFLINGFGNGHLEYLLDFRNGHSVLAITPNNSESASLNQTNLNISANSHDSPLIDGNQRLNLLLSHYESYNKRMLLSSQSSISSQEQTIANNKVSEKYLHSTPIQPITELKPVVSDPCKIQKSFNAFVSPQKEIKSLREIENNLSKSNKEETDDNRFFVSSSCDSSTPSKRKLKHPLKPNENKQKNVSGAKLIKLEKSNSPNKSECETSPINIPNKKIVLNPSDSSGVPNLVSDNIKTQAQSESSLCSISRVKSEYIVKDDSVTDSSSKISTEFKDNSKEIIETPNSFNSEEPAPSSKGMPASKNVLESEITNTHSHVNVVEPYSKAENTIYPFVTNQSTTDKLESSNKDINLKDKKNSNLKDKKNKCQLKVRFNETNDVANSVLPIEVEIPNSVSTLNVSPPDSADICLKTTHKHSKKKPKPEFKCSTNEKNDLTSPSVITNLDVSHTLNDAEIISPSVFTSKFSDNDSSKVLSKNIDCNLYPRKMNNKFKTSHCNATSESLCSLPSTSRVVKSKYNNVHLSDKNANLSTMQTRSKKNLFDTKINVNNKKRRARRNKKKRKKYPPRSKLNQSVENNSGVKNKYLINFVSATEIEAESGIKQQFQNGFSKPSACVVDDNFDSIQTENEQNSLLNQHNITPKHNVCIEDVDPNGLFINNVNAVQSSTKVASKNSLVVKAEVHCSIDKSHEDEKSFSSIPDTEDLLNGNTPTKDSPIKEKINSRDLPLSPGLFAVNANTKFPLLPYIAFKNGKHFSSPSNVNLDSVISPIKSPVKKETPLLHLSSSLVNENNVELQDPVCSLSPKMSPKGSSPGQNLTSKKNNTTEDLNTENIALPCNGISSPNQPDNLKQDSCQSIHMNGDCHSHIKTLDSVTNSCHSSTISDDEHALIIAEDLDDEMCTPQEEGFETQNANNAINNVDSAPNKKKKSKKNKKSPNLTKNNPKRPKLIKDEPSDSSVTISKAFEEMEKLKFDESHFKLRVHTLVNALINPANASDTDSVLFYIIQYLSLSRRTPIMTFTCSHDSSVLLPQLERCIVSSLIQVEHKMKNHLKGLLSSAIKSLYLLVLAKGSVPIYGLCAFCRVFTEICKYRKNSKEPIMLCCDLLKIQHKFAPYLIASIIGVWPDLFAVSNEISAKELMYKQSVIYGVEKKPHTLTDTQWKHCHSIFSKFVTVPTISNVIDAISYLKKSITDDLLKEDHIEEEYMLIDPLVIFSACEGWTWTKKNVLDNFAMPQLATYAVIEPNKRAFNLFCTLYSEIGLLSPDNCQEPIDTLNTLFLHEGAQEYVKPIAACSLLKLVVLKNQASPPHISEWISENESLLSTIELSIRRRTMSNTPELTEQDIVPA